MIKNLPIAGLKLDKNSIQDESSNNRNLVKSLILLAENMGFTVVADGIETKEQLDFLKSYTHGKVQGYYLSKPLPKNEITKLLRRCEKA